jgi:transcription antitermination protein NusB
MTVTLPGTITVSDLATVLGADIEEVAEVLRAGGEPSAADDVVSGEVAVTVASALGVVASVEPRDLALGYLYARDTHGSPDLPEGRAGILVQGVLSDLDGLDERIEQASEHWSVARMPVIDRNVLRIALFELETQPEVPTKVVLAEAVRLASTFSTERSASFVNGVLSSLARDARS